MELTLTKALIFYIILISILSILGIVINQKKQVYGCINGFAIGVIISLQLYNYYKDKFVY
jgi:hypothetical protein